MSHIPDYDEDDYEEDEYERDYEYDRPDEDDEPVTSQGVYGRAYAHFGNHELAREAVEMYPGDFI